MIFIQPTRLSVADQKERRIYDADTLSRVVHHPVQFVVLAHTLASVSLAMASPILSRLGINAVPGKFSIGSIQVHGESKIMLADTTAYWRPIRRGSL